MTAEDGVDVSQPPPPIGLYPFNPLEPPPPLEAPPPLPGFEETEKPPLPAEDELKEETGTADPDEMEMSDKSPSRSLSQASTKKDMDMDCTVTSDEEGECHNFSWACLDLSSITLRVETYLANMATTINPANFSVGVVASWELLGVVISLSIETLR